MADNNPMPALQRLLGGGGMSENGWSGLDQQNADADKQHEAALARYEDAAKIASAFNGSAGREALRKLRELTIDRPTWPAEGAGGFYDAAAYGFAREGQNSIIRHIERCIEHVEKGPPVAPGTVAAAARAKGGKKANISTNN